MNELSRILFQERLDLAADITRDMNLFRPQDIAGMVAMRQKSLDIAAGHLQLVRDAE